MPSHILKKATFELPDRGKVDVQLCRKGDTLYAWSKSYDAFGQEIARHTETIDPSPGTTLEKAMTMAARSVKASAKRDVRRAAAAKDIAKDIDI